ncbi:MAG: KH domain-containing protein [Candidatus Saccharimonadales bacterium]
MSVSIDQQFVEFVVKSLVSNPDDVSIERRVDEKGVLLELTVHPDDLGRVIGKRGATAQSLRTLLRALGTKQEARYNLKIVDVDRIGQEDGAPKAERPEPVVKKDDTSDDSFTTKADDTVAPPTVSKKDDEDEAKEETKDKESDALARTRAELADLDDLDI